MTQEDFENFAQSYFNYITKYISENSEIDLESDIENYLTKENRAFELKLHTDAKFYTDITINILKELDYFESIENSKNFKLSNKGKNYLRLLNQTRSR